MKKQENAGRAVSSPALFGPIAKDEWKLVMRLAWPIAIEQIVLMVMSIIASMINGSISARSLSALGMVNMYITFSQAALMLVPTGSIVIVARMVGARDLGAARDAAEQAAFLAVFVSLGTVILVETFAPAIIALTMPNADAELLTDTLSCCRIAFWSFPGYYISLVMGGVLRGKGDTRTPMLVSFVTNGGLLVCTILFVSVLKWGLMGASLALLVSRSVGGLLMMIPQFSKKNVLRLTVKGVLRPRWGIQLRMLRVGLFCSVEQTVIQGGYLFLSSQVVALGNMSYTVYQVISSLGQISMLPSNTFYNACLTAAGQHMGAKQMDRAKLATNICLVTGFASSVLLAILSASVGKWSASLYSSDPEVIYYSARVLWIQVVTIGPALVINVMFGLLRAAGDTRYTSIASFIGVWVVRTPLIYYWCFVLDYGILGVYWSFMVDYCLRGSLYLVRYYRGKWMGIQV